MAKLGAGGAGYYLDQVAGGAEEYYTGAGEAPGCWLGAGGAALGLAGEVDADDLHAVLAGGAPGGGRLVRPNRRVPGFDLTFSAPKSVSLLHALGGREASQGVVAAHEAAVDAALGYLEREACWVRRGRNGVEQVKANGFVAAAFRHRTSRAGDPQLHTHVLVANLAEGADGVWRTLDARHLYRHQRTAGFLYQAQLRAELTRSLGVAWRPARCGMAELAGVPDHVLRVFSRRRQQILRHLARRGQTSAKAAEIAALETRGAKDHVALGDLRAEWRTRSLKAGMNPAHWRQLQPRTTDQGLTDGLTEGLTFPAALLGEQLTEQDSTFTRLDVLRALAEGALAGADIAAIEAAADRFLAHSATRLADGRYSMPDHIEIERHLLANATQRMNTDAGVVEDELVDEAIEEASTLTDEQQTAVRRLTTAGHGVDVIIGHPGAGKTHALRAAGQAWQQAGYQIIGTALAARTARQLESMTGITSMTLTRLLTNGLTRPLDDRTVIVVDEAGMVGTRQLAELLDYAARARAKVVLVGDDQQLPEIAAGGAFRVLAQMVGAVELTENRRQTNHGERRLLADLRRGRTRPAVERLAATRRLTTAPTTDDALDRMIEDWRTARQQGRQVLLLAHRRTDVDQLNQLAQDRLHADGQLGPDVSLAGRELHIGDELLLLRNDRRLGVLNGQRAVIQAAEDRTLTVALDDGRQVDLPLSYVSMHVQLGYASTVHKAQGATVDVALVLLTDGVHRQAAYTALSRGRHHNHLYVPDDSQAHDHLDNITRRLNRDGTKRLALDHGVEPGP